MNTAPASEYDDNEIVNPSANPYIASMPEARLSRRSTLKGGIGAATVAQRGRGRRPQAQRPAPAARQSL